MRGDVWWVEVVHRDGEVKGRPMVELSSVELQAPIVVPVTTTDRQVLSSAPIDGQRIRGFANCLAIETVDRHQLGEKLDSLSDQNMAEICTALSYATGCF